MSEYIDDCQNRLSKVGLNFWHLPIVIDTLSKEYLVSIATTVIEKHIIVFLRV